ncbi:MAG: hypothetical protein EF813_01605 [Methanosarcinales archaeon]|nr:MAG: hypothetical protein EF813_01605 [Methanosarcinales archaeon]
MKLKNEEADLFHRLYLLLLFYVNRKHPVIEDLCEPDLMCESPEAVNELHEKLCGDPGLIDSFVSENPFDLNDEELGIVKSWKNFVKGRFLIVAHLKNYSVFMIAEGEQKVYGVLGLHDAIEDMMPPIMPMFVETTLIPFKGRIIYCGFMGAYNIRIGSSMRRSIQAEYQQSKRRFGVITSLDAPVHEKEDSAEELLKFYARSESNRDRYWEETEDILSEKPELMNVYHREVGKSNARKISKRLSEIGVAPAWFAIFENVVIASGKSEKVVRVQIADLLPVDKVEGAHIFRYDRKGRKKK